LAILNPSDNLKNMIINSSNPGIRFSKQLEVYIVNHFSLTWTCYAREVVYYFQNFIFLVHPLLLVLPSTPGSTLYSWFYQLSLVLPSTPGSTLYSRFYPLILVHPLLLVLPSTLGSTSYLLFYPLPLVLPSTPGSTLYSWFYPLLLVLTPNSGSTHYPWFQPSTPGSTL